MLSAAIPHFRDIASAILDNADEFWKTVVDLGSLVLEWWRREFGLRTSLLSRKTHEGPNSWLFQEHSTAPRSSTPPSLARSGGATFCSVSRCS